MAKKDKEIKEEKRRFKLAEGATREVWTEEDRKDFLEKAEKFRPFVEHLTTKAPEKKKSRFDLPVID